MEYERCGPDPSVDGADRLKELPVEWAQAIAARLSEYQVKAVYYLPVPAVAGTADAIAGVYALRPDVLPGFNGAEGVSWNGLTAEEAAVLDSPFKQGESNTVNIKFPFVADINMLRPKIAISLDSVTEKHEKETAVIVSHRALTVIMILHLLHMGNQHYCQIAQNSGAVNLFEIRSGTPSAIYINDTCHLEGLS